MVTESPILNDCVKKPEALLILHRLIAVPDDAEDLVRIRPNHRLPLRNRNSVVGFDLFQVHVIIQACRFNRLGSSCGFVKLRSESMPGRFPSIHHGRLAVRGREIVWHWLGLHWAIEVWTEICRVPLFTLKDLSARPLISAQKSP